MLRSSPRPSHHRSRDAAVALAVMGLVGFLTWGSVGAAQSPERTEPLAGTASLTGMVEAPRPFTAARVYARNIWFPDASPPTQPAVIGKLNPRDETFTFYPKPQAVADSPKLQHTVDGAVWHTARTSIPGATGFGVLYPDEDKITTLGGYPLHGPPGYAFTVAPGTE